MKILRRIFNTYWYKSGLFSILQRFSLVFFGLVSYLLLVRCLSTPVMGTWALFLAISTTFEMSKYGLLKNGFVALYHTTDKDEDRVAIASSSLLINAVFTFIFIIIIFVIASPLSIFFKASSLSQLLYLYIPIALFLIPFSHFEYMQLASMSFKGIFAAYFVRQGVFLFLVCIGVIWFPAYITLQGLVILQLIGIMTGSLISCSYTRKYFRYIFSPRKVWIKKLLNYGRYVFGSGICSNIFGSLDRYMTASFMSPVAVAYYDVSARINNLIDVPTMAAADVIFPKSAQAAYTEGNERVKYFYEKMVSILIGLVLPVSIILFIFAKEVVILIAGEKYAAATTLVRIAMLYAFMRPIQIQASNVLNSINHPRITFILNVIILSFTIIVDYLCIRMFGFIGAAYGSLLTTVFSTILTFYYLRKITSTEIMGIVRKIPDFYKEMISKIMLIFEASPVAIDSDA